MPSMEMYEKSKLGKFVLGGCCISGESTKWHCLDCEHEFGKYLDDINDNAGRGLQPRPKRLIFIVIQKVCVRHL